jgi:hypothetical protein
LVDDLKKVLSNENMKHDDCLQQTELAAGKQLVRTCMVMGCRNAIDETICGSGYCVTHEHHPVGQASFEVVRQVLIDIRESTGNAGVLFVKEGWDKLETYTTMEELGKCRGVKVKDGKLVEMNFECWNLTGTLPPRPPPALGQNTHMTAFLLTE